VGHLKFLCWSVLLAGMLADRASFASDEPFTRVLSCRALAEASARLACFDRETAVLADGAPSSATPPPARPAAPPAAIPEKKAPDSAPALTATQQFGLTEERVAAREVAAGTRVADIKDIKARLTAVARDPRGLLTFTLDNGQTWRQMQDSGDLQAKVGDTVTVSSGWFHSFEMTFASGRFCKVDRIR